MVTPCFSAHSNSLPLMYSGPLSTLMVPGLPRHSMWRRIRKRSGGPFSRRRIKAPDHALSGQGKVDLDAQALAVEVIQHVQQPELAAITQPVGHEISLRRMKAFAYRATHRPGHVGRLRHGQSIRFVPLQPLAGFDLLPGNGLHANHERAQVQFQFAVDPVDPFVVPAVPFDVAQMQKA